MLSRARAVKKAAAQVEDRQQEIELREQQLRNREVDLDRRFRAIDGLVNQVSEAELAAVVLAAEKSALEHRLKMLKGVRPMTKPKRERLATIRNSRLAERTA